MAGTSTAPSAVGMLIRQYRGDRSQREYGEAIGVGSVAVLKYERGDYLPRLGAVYWICEDAGLNRAERRAFLDLMLDVARQRDQASRSKPLQNTAANRE